MCSQDHLPAAPDGSLAMFASDGQKSFTRIRSASMYPATASYSRSTTASAWSASSPMPKPHSLTNALPDSRSSGEPQCWR